MYKVVAYHLSSTVNIKACKSKLPWKLQFQDSDELFFNVSDHSFIYIFHYGIVSCFNMTASQMEDVFQKIEPFCIEFRSNRLSEEIDVVITDNVIDVQFNHIILPHLDDEMIRLIMLNVSQSVALDSYSHITEALLSETNNHTVYLENKGKLDISGHKLKRFIGKILNIKNKISENLYIFDSPEITWENEQLSKLNKDLKQAFDLKDRYRLIHDRVEIIKENLELFKDIMDHKESSKLEWIIILLILVEVVDMFILKFY